MGCQAIYEMLSKAKGPSVVLKVVIAFLLPLLTFIAALTIFEQILTRIIETNHLRTVISFIAAFLITALVVFITRLINIKLSKNR